ncbi:hypothetical protein SERLA73DRAFT_80282 [Serpula lacrymans var. lacrymans S7.3]|uniref:Uncharacterized protein n=2 Tax=Serpula lacrymans var. lacrymans TaxID=341189 RepID=F8QJA1_SERL3|nr:uncharacterized protein SERLADRAFT_434177 [Serpula lacrymans var. lacrymans S7.9]EGN91619.1 hypothetical protein SERLA73DRAFT_80282 [Serpula lacrymans var. lacrymans S7.3]EGO28278.1 hypothetical protein SERLADRAFT_434177 [Serpula lacrymans var. lacrymans S7.9]
MQQKRQQEDCCKQKEQSGVLTEWKKLDNLQKTQNTARREAYHEAMHLWKEESNLAKQEQRQVGWAKLKLGKLESQAPKPGPVQGKGDETSKGNGEVTGSEDEQSDENIDGMESDGESAEE